MATSDREKIAKRRQRRRRRRLKPQVKLFLFLFICFAATGGYVGYKYYQSQNAPDPYGKMESLQNASKKNNYDLVDDTMPAALYWVIDVGAGEAIYVKSGETDILIDTGCDVDGKKVIDAVKGELTDGLDYLLVTSPSKRRIGGLKAVCDALKPAKIITCPLDGETKMTFIRSVGDIPTEEGKNMTLNLSENSFFYIFLPEVSSDDPYDKSLMTYFKYGNTGFFAESDAGEEEEARVLPDIKNIDVLVLARAGSSAVNQLAPSTNAATYAVSDAAGGGPDEAVIDGIRGTIYATYSSGTLKFTSNGQTVESNLDQNKRIENKKEPAEAEEEQTDEIAAEEGLEAE